MAARRWDSSSVRDRVQAQSRNIQLNRGCHRVALWWEDNRGIYSACSVLQYTSWKGFPGSERFHWSLKCDALNSGDSSCALLGVCLGTSDLSQQCTGMDGLWLDLLHVQCEALCEYSLLQLRVSMIAKRKMSVITRDEWQLGHEAGGHCTYCSYICVEINVSWSRESGVCYSRHFPGSHDVLLSHSVPVIWPISSHQISI